MSPKTKGHEPQWTRGAYMPGFDAGDCPERRLALAVLVEALHDLTGVGNTVLKKRTLKNAAYHAWLWIFSEHEEADFFAWCERAGILPSTIRARAVELMQSKGLTKRKLKP